MVSIRAALLLSVACLGALVGRLVGQTLTAEECERLTHDFVHHQQETRTYQAQLLQTLRLRGLRDPIVSRGRVWYAAPGSFAMAFTQPAGEFLIMTDDLLAVKKANKPLLRRSMQAAQRADSGGWLMLRDLFRNGATNAVDHYDAMLHRTNDHVVVTLTPKQRVPHSGQPVSIENQLALGTLEVELVRLQFENDNSITYEFLNPVRNQSVDPAVFALPKTAESGASAPGDHVRSKVQ